VTATTTEVSNRLTNANGIGESFPSPIVNLFRISIFRGHFLDRGLPRFGRAPIEFKILVWEVGVRP